MRQILLLLIMLLPLVACQAEPEVEPTPVPAAETTPVPIATPAPDHYQEGLKLGMEAATAAKTAKTKEEWSTVADKWNAAVLELKKIEANNPIYQQAKVKADSYVKAYEVAVDRATAAEPTNSTLASSSTPPPTESPSTQTADGRTLLGTSPTGYTIWLGQDKCIYIKDLREGDLSRMNVTLGEFKKVIKEETGAQCVFFE